MRRQNKGKICCHSIESLESSVLLAKSCPRARDPSIQNISNVVFIWLSRLVGSKDIRPNEELTPVFNQLDQQARAETGRSAREVAAAFLDVGHVRDVEVRPRRVFGE